MAIDPAKQLERNARLMELLARTALSDQRAFAELYRLTSSHLYGAALRILRDSAAAEEVLQESFVNVWHHANSYVSGKSQPLTWLTRIVRNRCLDQLRRKDVDTVAIDDEEESVTIADEGPSPLEMLVRIEKFSWRRLFQTKLKLRRKIEPVGARELGGRASNGRQ